MISAILENTTRAELLRGIERNLESYLTMVLILVYTTFIVYRILSRTLGLGRVGPWLQEVVIGLFIWAAWLAVASLVRQDAHIRFTTVIERFPRWGVYLVYWIEWVLWIALAGIIFRYSIPYIGLFIGTGSTITGTSIPLYYLHLSIPVGFALILVRTFQQIVIVTRKYRAGEELLTGTDITGTDS